VWTGFVAKIDKTFRINDVLYEIHRDISVELPVKRLAQIAAFSEQHFHRVFHQVMGEPVHQYIRRIRLEQAGNQLMFDVSASVQEVALKCGFQSLSSFSRAFKQQFGVAPGRWRKGDREMQAGDYLLDPEIKAGYERIQHKTLPEPDIVQIPPQMVAYVRHQGYGRSITQVWRRLLAWAEQEQIDASRQLGLHHSNPAWVPLSQCRYVACIAIERPIARRGFVNTLTIPGGLHARFVLTGVYGELLPYLSQILESWLPASGFIMKTTPAWVDYHKNQFLTQDDSFELDFYLPIGYY